MIPVYAKGMHMYFYEVVDKCDEDEAVRLFLEMCTDSPDIKLTEQRIRHAIAEMKGMEAVKSDIGMIEIEHVRTEDEFDAVHLLEHRTGIRYGLEANPWADTLGYPVDERSLSEYGYEKFVSLVLWEMTWFGYDDRTVQEHVSTWETE